MKNVGSTQNGQKEREEERQQKVDKRGKGPQVSKWLP